MVPIHRPELSAPALSNDWKGAKAEGCEDLLPLSADSGRPDIRSKPASSFGHGVLVTGSILLARLPKAHLRPIFHCPAKIPGVAREKHWNPIMVLGERAAVMAGAEAVELIALCVEPAGRLVGHVLEPRAEIVLGLQPRL